MSEMKSTGRVDSLSPSTGVSSSPSLLMMNLGNSVGDTPFSFDCESTKGMPESQEPTPSVLKPPSFPASPFSKRSALKGQSFDQLQRDMMMRASGGQQQQQQQIPQPPFEVPKGIPPDETSKQILSACTPDQLKELSKLTPGALQNLQAIVSQFMAAQQDPAGPAPTQQQQQQAMLHMAGARQQQHQQQQQHQPQQQQQQQQQQQNRQHGGAGLPESHLLRAQQQGNGGAALASGQLSTENPSPSLRNMGMAEDLPIMSLPAMPPGMMSCGPGRTLMTPRNRRPLADMNLGSFDLESPRFSSLMDFSAMDNFSFGAAPMEIEKQKEEEIVISPRSARMLLNAVQEGSGYPTAAAMTAPGAPAGPQGNGRQAAAPAASNAQQNYQQQQNSANGANNSSCSAATAGASPMQCDGPRQPTPPQTPRVPQVLSLQPFDSLVRNEDDEKYLNIFNSWMSNNAIDSGRPFASLMPSLPFTPKKAQQSQLDNPLTA